jgi:hypothetical protein
LEADFLSRVAPGSLRHSGTGWAIRGPSNAEAAVE